MEYDWANVTKYTENSDGSITAQVTLYSAPIEEYGSNGQYLGDPVPDFDAWYYKDSSEWQVPCEHYKSGFAETMLKPYEYKGTQTWQIVSINGVPSPRILPAGVSVEILPVGSEFAFAATGSRYQLYDSNGISWQEAKAFCENSEGHLATLTTSDENAFVFSHSITNDVESAYFGLSDYEDEGNWKWVTNEPVTYTNWHSDEPNSENDNEDYAMFYWKFDDGTWNDGDFGGSAVDGGTIFICEWDGQPLIDSDKDGLPDEWEINGFDYGGVHLPLNEWGADPNKKDVFVEIDYMSGYKPSQAALNMVAKAFDERGINLHIDFGVDSVDYVTDKVWGDYSGGTEISYEKIFDASKNNWIAVVNASMPSAARQRVFHHCLYVNQFRNNGIVNSSGLGNVQGQIMIVALGIVKKIDKAMDKTKAEAGTFMHELGHNLGLQHGGDQGSINITEDIKYRYKPNYLSVMNYSFQFTGLYPNGKLDFSNFKLPDLNEQNLSEFNGVDPQSLTIGTGLGTIYYSVGVTGVSAHTVESVAGKAINWNGNKLWVGWTDIRDNIENSVKCDINTGENGQTASIVDKLTGFDDWYYIINTDWGEFNNLIGNADMGALVIESNNLEYPAEMTLEEIEELLTVIENAEMVADDEERPYPIWFWVTVGVVIIGGGITTIVVLRRKRARK